VRFLAEHGPDVYQEVRWCVIVGAPLLSIQGSMRVTVLDMCLCWQCTVPMCTRVHAELKMALVVVQLACPVTMEAIPAFACCSRPRDRFARTHESVSTLSTAACPVLSPHAAARGVCVGDVARAGGPLQDVPQHA
jgi:hypothetical protein